MSLFIHFSAALAAISLGAPALAEVEVHDAYAIAATPTSVSGAAFMSIHNHGGAADRLIGVRSDVAERTELHTHLMTDDGLVQMIHVTEGFDFPTDGAILLERGGHHVMFMGLTTPLIDGAVVDITLVFKLAGEVTVQVPVDLSRLGGDMGDDMGAMDHGVATEGE